MKVSESNWGVDLPVEMFYASDAETGRSDGVDAEMSEVLNTVPVGLLQKNDKWD